VALVIPDKLFLIAIIGLVLRSLENGPDISFLEIV
jgi:hypothetical protein